MPALRRSFDDDPPALAVVDSSFIFESLIDARTGDGRHEACRAFATKMHAAGSVLLVSPLIYVEAPMAWRRLYNRGVLGSSQLNLDVTADRVAAFREASRRLRRFIEQFEHYEIPFTRRLVDRATRLAAHHNLKAHDAFIAAIATDRSPNVDLVGIDRDFRRVDGLTLWTL